MMMSDDNQIKHLANIYIQFEFEHLHNISSLYCVNQINFQQTTNNYPFHALLFIHSFISVRILYVM